MEIDKEIESELDQWQKEQGRKKVCVLKLTCWRKKNGSPLINYSWEEEGVTKKDIAMVLMELEKQKLILLSQYEPDLEITKLREKNEN